MEEGAEGKSLEERFNIPPVEFDLLQTQALKQLATSEADKTRRLFILKFSGLLAEIHCTENQWIVVRKAQEIVTHRMAHYQEYIFNIAEGNFTFIIASEKQIECT